jgi:hypothetical protein
LFIRAVHPGHYNLPIEGLPPEWHDPRPHSVVPKRRKHKDYSKEPPEGQLPSEAYHARGGIIEDMLRKSARAPILKQLGY